MSDSRVTREKELELHIREVVDRSENEINIDGDDLAREELEGKLIAKYIAYCGYY